MWGQPKLLSMPTHIVAYSIFNDTTSPAQVIKHQQQCFIIQGCIYLFLLPTKSYVLHINISDQ